MIRRRDERGRSAPVSDPSKSAYRKRNVKLRASRCEAEGRRHHPELHLHHKDGDYTNFAPDNLQTLCRTHHLRAHGKQTRQQMGWRFRKGS